MAAGDVPPAAVSRVRRPVAAAHGRRPVSSGA
jgi:hypothetical protein